MIRNTILWMLFFVSPVLAHEVRPAYLEIVEEKSNEYSALWKTPMRGDMRLGISAQISGQLEILSEPVTYQSNGAAIQTWKFKAADSLHGQDIYIKGLSSTMTDVLVRVVFLDKSSWIKRLTPHEPRAKVPQKQTFWSVVKEYLKLGIEHILFGIDHLLFVLVLFIMTRFSWKLFKTITAFTVAHSITLGLAALGFVHVPSRPVEAVIALSIVFVALEIVNSYKGKQGITARAPWVVAFGFGLLHGFGFAGALSEIGLPTGHIPTALVFFNLGVEIGQLCFITVVSFMFLLIARFKPSLPGWIKYVPPYVIGGVAMFWVLQRTILI